MTLGRREWLLGGAAAIALLSAVLVMGNAPSVLRPVPVHQVVLALWMGGGFVLVLPAIYLVTLAGLWGTRWLAQVSLAASLAVAGLSVAWFALTVPPHSSRRRCGKTNISRDTRGKDGGWLSVQRAMRPDVVVVRSPTFDP
jgi:hypothetical protein